MQRNAGWFLGLRLPRRGSTRFKVRVILRVDGILWEQVETLKSARPDDRVYVVSIADDGRATIKFGDGKRGRRPPAEVQLVSAHYRTGDGSAGNVPEQGSKESIAYLDVWTKEVTAIEDVQLREPALGGVDSSDRGREQRRK